MSSIEAVILVNLGSPDSTSRDDVKKYLLEFLSDPLVIDAPRWWWLPLLKNIILPVRSGKSAKLYQSIWLNEGSPLTVYTKKLAEKLNKQSSLQITWAMRYGKHNIEAAVNKLKNQGIKGIKIIPLFPQYSKTTVETISEQVRNIQSRSPELYFEILQSYASQAQAVVTWAHQIHEARQGREDYHVLFSFHGLPQRYIDQGDPYLKECLTSAHLVAERLKLQDWSVSFQSQFGPEQWLEPATDDALITLAEEKRKVILIAPGFATDCLETLEELDESYQELYKAYGGKSFYRLPCLNDSSEAMGLYQALI